MVTHLPPEKPNNNRRLTRKDYIDATVVFSFWCSGAASIVALYQFFSG